MHSPSNQQFGLHCEKTRDDDCKTVQDETASTCTMLSNKAASTILEIEDKDYGTSRQENELFKPYNDQDGVPQKFVCRGGKYTTTESDELSLASADTEEPLVWSRMRRRGRRVLKICGYVALATVGLPVITGTGVVTLVVLTAAGTVSPPVLLGLKMYKKYTSNPWWTYSRKHIRYAVVKGVIIGTIFLPLLAPWGVYKLFQMIVTKFKNARFWKRPVEYEEMFLEIVDDESLQRLGNLNGQSVSAEGDSNGNRIMASNGANSSEKTEAKSESDRYQMPPNEITLSIYLRAARYFNVKGNSDVDETASDLKRFQAIFNSSTDTTGEEELSEINILFDSDNCLLWPSVRQPDDGREAFSGDENEYGRRDSQQVWARRARSEHSCSGKFSDETFQSVLKWREAKSDRLTEVLRRTNSNVDLQLLNWREDCPSEGHDQGNHLGDARQSGLQNADEMQQATAVGTFNECGYQSGTKCPIPTCNTDREAKRQSDLNEQETNRLNRKEGQKPSRRHKRRSVKQSFLQHLGRPVQDEGNEHNDKGTITSQAAQEKARSPEERETAGGIRSQNTHSQAKQDGFALKTHRKTGEEVSTEMLTLRREVNNHEPMNKTKEEMSPRIGSGQRNMGLFKRKGKMVAEPGDFPAQEEQQRRDKNCCNGLPNELKKLGTNGQNRETGTTETRADDVIERYDQID